MMLGSLRDIAFVDESNGVASLEKDASHVADSDASVFEMCMNMLHHANDAELSNQSFHHNMSRFGQRSISHRPMLPHANAQIIRAQTRESLQVSSTCTFTKGTGVHTD